METHSSEEEKSKNEEDDSEEESIYIKIKKEKPNIIYLENKIYQKLISQIEKYNEMIKNIKMYKFKSETNGESLPNINIEQYEKIIQEKDNSLNILKA